MMRIKKRISRKSTKRSQGAGAGSSFSLSKAFSLPSPGGGAAPGGPRRHGTSLATEGDVDPDCSCPICAYLAESDWPTETLSDGIVVHRVPEGELPALQALMNVVGSGFGDSAPSAPMPIDGTER